LAGQARNDGSPAGKEERHCERSNPEEVILNYKLKIQLSWLKAEIMITAGERSVACGSNEKLIN
jgi:hypothetical protein